MSIYDCHCHNCTARRHGHPVVTLSRGDCPCDPCKAIGRNAYGESAVDRARLEADRALRDLNEMRESALSRLSESTLDRHMREFTERFYTTEKARLLNELTKSTQRSSMAFPSLTDCNCTDCRVERARSAEAAAKTSYPWYSMKIDTAPMASIDPAAFAEMRRALYDWTFNISYDPAKETKKPMNPDLSTPDGLAAAVRDLAGKDNNADLSGVTRAVERATAERNERIAKSLRGMADLAVMAGAKGKRFVIVYWSGSEAKIAQGIEYPVEKRDDKGDSTTTTVLVNDYDHPCYGKYNSMPKLRKALDALNLTYHIAYYDN